MENPALNDLPAGMILLEPCPGCGALPVMHVKYRKHNGNRYWVACNVCGFAGPSCTGENGERDAELFWNKNANNHSEQLDHVWRKVDCIPTNVLEKLLKISVAETKTCNSVSRQSSDWISSELGKIIAAREMLPERLKQLNETPDSTEWYNRMTIREHVRALRKTASLATSGTFAWIVDKLCGKFMEGEQA